MELYDHYTAFFLSLSIYHSFSLILLHIFFSLFLSSCISLSERDHLNINRDKSKRFKKKHFEYNKLWPIPFCVFNEYSTFFSSFFIFNKGRRYLRGDFCKRLHRKYIINIYISGSPVLVATNFYFIQKILWLIMSSEKNTVRW